MSRAPAGHGPALSRHLVGGLLLAAGLALLAWQARSFSARGKTPPVYGRLPGFVLVDQLGREVTSRDLRGRPWIADFIFTRCPDFCPALSARMAALGRELARRGLDARLVSITVDPEHDSPEVLRRYAGRYRAEAGQWLFLTGRQDAVLTLVRDGFRLPVEERGAVIAHSNRFVLVDGAGRIRGYYDSADREAQHTLLRDIERLARDGAAEP